MMHVLAPLTISGAFALGIGVERMWPAAQYGGGPAMVWIVGGVILSAVGFIALARS